MHTVDRQLMTGVHAVCQVCFSLSNTFAFAGLGSLVDYSGDDSSDESDDERAARPKIVSFF